MVCIPCCSLNNMKLTKKLFREHLNKLCENSPNNENGKYRQLKRKYGDYLYYQDREKFNVDYNEWLTTLNNLKMYTSSKNLFNELLPIVESFKENDTETLNKIIDILMQHFGYTEFPIRGFSKMMQLGYLFQQLESTMKKESK